MIKVFFAKCKETRKDQHEAAYKLLYAAAEFCGYDVSLMKVEKTENGKPYFEGCDGIFFSISHSGEYAACVIGDIPCGIDIEKEREVPFRVSKRYLNGASGKDALRLWTMRESFGKIDGQGFFKGESFPEDAEFLSFEYEKYTVSVCTLGETCLKEAFLWENGENFEKIPLI